MIELRRLGPGDDALVLAAAELFAGPALATYRSAGAVGDPGMQRVLSWTFAED